MYNFKKHTLVGKRFEDRITVTRSRQIGFPTQFYADNSIRDFKYAVLYFDETKNAIGVKFAAEPEEGGISINRHKEYGGYISATSFFKANRINTKKFAGRYDYSKVPLTSLGLDGSGNLFVIELKENSGKETADEEAQ